MSGDDSPHPAPRAAGHDVDGDPLPTASVNKPAPRARAGDDYPRHIENYRIIRRLGAGGMGVVFEAEQENPRRLVALKLINAGVASREALRRFQHEATVLGRLQHAGIAQIYEAGTFDEGEGGRPYFAMELVRGQPITEFAAARDLGRDQRLELLAKVCDAVQHAHLKAIIHRDLKPGNILVTAEGQPKVLDFGVARATDADVRATTLQTRADQLIGTLPYMSPEQALGDSNELDMRSDVYALGVIGYELLTGRLPYDVDRRTVFEAVRVIREEEPTRLSAIDRSLRGDVETIFAKSLEKDRNQRYQSAADLASDIRRFLTDEPIVARPPSVSYRMRKFARRHKGMVVAAGTITCVLIAGTIVSTLLAFREASARQLAQQEAQRANKASLKSIEEAEQARQARADAQAQAERAQIEAQKAEAISNFHRTMLSRTNPAFAQGRDVTVREVLDQAASDVGTMFPGQPLLEAAIRGTIAESYSALSEFGPAYDQFDRTAKLLKDNLGDTHADTLTAEANLAVGMHDLGRFEDAVTLERSVLERRQKTLGPDHPDTISAEVNLAAGLRDAEHLDEAEALLKSAIERGGRILPAGDRTMITAMGTLASLLKDRGRLDDSAAMFEQTITLARKSLGENDHDTLSNIDNYASLLQIQGKHERALEMFRDLYETQLRIFGPTHAATLVCTNNYAIALQNAGELARAQEMFQKVVTDGRSRFGETHPDVLVAMRNLAILHYVRGELPEAERLLKEAVEAQIRRLGEGHTETIASMSTLGLVLGTQDKNDEAEPWHRRAFEAQKRAVGADHPDTLAMEAEFASFLRDIGRLEEAEPLYIDALAGLRRVRGDDAEPTLVVMYQYLGLLQRQKRWQDALPLSEELNLRSGAFPPTSPFGMMTPMRVGRTMTGLGRYAEAETLLKESLRRLESVEGTSPDWHKTVIESLVDLYTNWNKPDELAMWRKRLEAPTTAPGGG